MSSTYRQTLDWLYTREAKLGMDFRLDRMQPVLRRLQNPDASFPSILIAGTNGKGSTAALLASVYLQAGFAVGLYTSPHLLSFRERVQVDGELIAEDRVVDFTAEINTAMEACGQELTFFEIATLMAFLEFRRGAVDLAVLEVGMGGRLDATNVVTPVCSVVTTVSRDHMRFLGDTVEQIAEEKAGVMRRGVPVVTGAVTTAVDRVLDAAAQKVGARRIAYGREFSELGDRVESGVRRSGLAGSHQRENAAVAAAVVRTLQGRFEVDEEDLVEGIARVRWPARLETIAESPLTVIDAAHNPDAADRLLAALRVLTLPSPRVLVFGVMADKDWTEMLAMLLPEFDQAVFVPVAQPRALDPAEALALSTDIKPAITAATALEGLRAARKFAGSEGSVVIAGSIFLAAEVYEEAGGRSRPFEIDID